MRGVFGILALVVVLAIVALLAKKQLSTAQAPAIPVVAVPGQAAPAAGSGPVSVKQQMDQMKAGIEATLQQPHPTAGEKQ
jgi:hypothetical protein